MKAISGICRAKTEKGFALLAVLLLLLLITGLAVGLSYMVQTQKRVSGSDVETTMAYYGAESAMEKMMTDLAALYQQKQNPTIADINGLVSGMPTIDGIKYPAANYILTAEDDGTGHPRSYTSTIASGPNKGLYAELTNVNLQVVAERSQGTQSRMFRNVEVAKIPAFQFGVFCGVGDCSYFNGPVFTFKGRVHTNGDLYLANQSRTDFTDKVTAAGDIIRYYMANGYDVSTSYTGPVNISTTTAGGPLRALDQKTEASLTKDWRPWAGLDKRNYENTSDGPARGWNNLSTGKDYYAGMVLNGKTGATALTLPFVGPNVLPIEIIRRETDGDTEMMKSSRMAHMASIRILLDDDKSKLKDDVDTVALHGTDIHGVYNLGSPYGSVTFATATTANVMYGTPGGPTLPIMASDLGGPSLPPTTPQASPVLLASASAPALPWGNVPVAAFTPGNALPALFIDATTNATLSVSPSSLTFTAEQGGPAPAAKSISVNATGGKLVFTVTKGESWLTVSPASGTTNTTVSVAVAPGTLLPGTYTDTVRIRSGTATRSVTVTFIVTKPSLIAAPTSLTFTANAGAAAPAQAVSIRSSAAAFNYSASKTKAWLSISPTSGATTGTMNVTPSAVSLSSGTYNDNITVTSANAQNSPLVIPVTFIVKAPATSPTPTPTPSPTATPKPSPTPSPSPTATPTPSNMPDPNWRAIASSADFTDPYINDPSSPTTIKDSTDPLTGAAIKTWPLLTGYIRIEYRAAGSTEWVPVTREWLSKGITRGSQFPDSERGITNGTNQPDAIIYLQQIADRGTGDKTITVPGDTLSNYLRTSGSVFDTTSYSGSSGSSGWAYYPITTYDPREGEVRDKKITTAGKLDSCALGGVINMVELDVRNLKRWLASSGHPIDHETYNGYILYFSDRRGNDKAKNDGGYDYLDVINAGDASGAPDGELDPEEDVYDGKFGADLQASDMVTVPKYMGSGFGLPVGQNPLTRRIYCSTIGRANAVVGPRHALRLVNGSLGNLPLKPDNTGGFTVASEQPVYVVGNYNAQKNDAFPTGCTSGRAAASVIADTVTLLSSNFSDIDMMKKPTDAGARVPVESWYRLAIATGKNKNFKHPSWSSRADDGTDGGVHNFLRFNEAWSDTLPVHYTGSMVNLFYSAYGVGIFKCCNTVYGAPKRLYAFDENFKSPKCLPPGTPTFKDVVALGFQESLNPR